MKKRFATVAGILALFMAQTTPKLYAQQSSSYLIDKGWRFSDRTAKATRTKLLMTVNGNASICLMTGLYTDRSITKTTGKI
nr:hypothetical protein [Porphyromonas macacae]